MIEVLVAVLVLAIGLLGVAALQTNALKNNQSAFQRSQASMLAYYMMDAMRAREADRVEQLVREHILRGQDIVLREFAMELAWPS